MVNARRVLGVAGSRRSYVNLLYLGSRFPLGVLYFTVLVTIGSTGLGLAPFAIGVPVLMVFLGVAWAMAKFERRLTNWWLGTEFAPMSVAQPGSVSLWRRLTAHLRNSVTWKSLLYLFLQLPAGFLVLTLILLTFSVALTLLLAPAVYFVDLATFTGGEGALASPQVQSPQWAGPLAPALPPVMCLCGFLLAIGALHVFNAVAEAWAWVAQRLLGLSQTGVRLAEARALATVEHERAELAEQRRRDLVVNASHELRTPIASIRGHVESLLMPEGERPSGSDLDRYLGVIGRETERLSALVDDLLAVAGNGAPPVRMDARAVDVERVVSEVYEAMAPLAGRDRKVKLIKALPEPPVGPALGDRDRLAQVLSNLVRNAIAYTPEGGIVSIALAELDAGHLALTVADTGIGIPAGELELVFDRFYRTDTSRARGTGGFGLGLAIARDLVETMGGRIQAESEVGVGSRFQVVLKKAA